MSKLEIDVLIHEAIEQTLKIQQSLLDHAQSTHLISIVKRLNIFLSELEQWRTGKFYLKDSSSKFVSQAREIEQQADSLSEKLWIHAPVSVLPICLEIERVNKLAKSDKTFTKHLRDHYNNIRLGLLEQMAGARLLEQNSDLGDEVERIFLQYLQKSLGQNLQILRGGHIYDHGDNRSTSQTDIIITMPDALGYCPAGAEDGKFNVMIDQVIAVISMKSTLSVSDLEKCWEEMQGLPDYAEKDKQYLHLTNHQWPLCFIVAAYTESLSKLQEKWHELRESKPGRAPQMLIALDSGYLRQCDGPWPFRFSQDIPENQRPQVRMVDDLLRAGLGLGLLNAAIVGRNCVVKNQPTHWIEGVIHKILWECELIESPKIGRNPFAFGIVLMPLLGVVSWGINLCPVHNRLTLVSLRVSGKELENPQRQATSRSVWDPSPFEPRWFERKSTFTRGKICALVEWVDPRDKEKHTKRIVIFDSESGTEMFHPLLSQFEIASDIEKLNMSELEPKTTT